ncbi:MAG TPA: hypothetical protein VGR07_03075, partial [Thermoanaerobaculia bacterium]|nr:hypothetical protein [Thermoanaerobaculia bacterium]
TAHRPRELRGVAWWSCWRPEKFGSRLEKLKYEAEKLSSRLDKTSPKNANMTQLRPHVPPEGFHYPEAHRFYFRELMTINSFYFTRLC